MKIIFKIAKTELRILFYSPIAWFLTVVFLVHCGISYISKLDYYMQMQETGGYSLSQMVYLTRRILTGYSGLFSDIMQKLYLYIPLLTMGLFSRETSSGTIKLLYSSPVQLRSIVMGKYLAMMIYNLLLVSIMGLFIILAAYNIRNADMGMLLSAALGFYLLLCTYAAIGLFMSCLTTYQVVAAVCTFVMIGTLSYIGSLWQGIDFVRDLTYFLSIAGRAEKMLSGLITTKDLIYFVLIIYIFLGLSIFRLKAGIETKPFLIRAGRYMAILVSALLIGYITSRPVMTGYWDVTANKSRTITPNAQVIVKNMGDEPLEIIAYNNLLSPLRYTGLPDQRNENLKNWEPYMRFKSNITLNYVQYYDTLPDSADMAKQYPGKSTKQIAEQFAKASNLDISIFKTPAEIRKIIDLKPELNRYVMQLKYKGRTTFLRVFDDQEFWPTETEVCAALDRLMKVKIPKVAFLTDDLERDINKMGDKDYKALTTLSTFRNSLINQGFDVDSISLKDKDIPTDISTLVIADPKIALTAPTMDKLQHYIDKGGNLLIAGEPNKQSLLNPLLEKIGVQLTKGMIIQASKDFSPDLVLPRLTAYASKFSKYLEKNVADSLQITMPGAAGLSYNNNGPFNIQPILTTNAGYTWNKKQKMNMDLTTSALTGENTGKMPTAGTVIFSPGDGDLKGPITVGIALTRNIANKEQRIVVIGDADFMSNAELQRNNIDKANFAFTTAIFSWLSYGSFPINTSRPDPKDTRLNITSKGLDTLRIALIWVLPGLFGLFGTILLIRRKRK